MSFRCQQCQVVTKPREPMQRQVTERRVRKYPNGGTGWEIVKEIAVCLRCVMKEQYE